MCIRDRVRHQLGQLVDQFGRAREGGHEVPVAVHVQRGRGHHRALPGSGQLPVAVQVAVPVERAGEARREALGEPVEVLLGEPRGQHLGVRRVREPAALRVDEGLLGAARARGVTRGGVQQLAQGGAGVRGELGLCDAGFLEVVPVEAPAEPLPHGPQRWLPAPEGRRHAQPRHPAHHVRPQQRGVPGHRRAPVVPDDERPLLAQRADQPDHVPHQVQDAVVGHVLGVVAAAVPALVRRDHPEAGLGQRPELVPPGVPGLREAVQQQHERALALLRDVQLNAVHVDHPMLNHASSIRV